MDVLSNVKVPRKAMEQALGGLGDGDEASVTSPASRRRSYVTNG